MKARFIAWPGDEVIVAITEENRSWGYRPFDNDEVVKVIEFSTVHRGRVNNFGNEPGLYYNTSWLTVENKAGKRDTINHLHLKNMPGSEYGSVERAELRIRDLPETPLWEMDVVKCRDEVMKVLSIDYDAIGTFCNDGVTPMPIYQCGRDYGGYSHYRERDLELVERGNVWKRAAGEKMVFADLEEEASFFNQVGEYEEIRNPALGSYKWTLEEALEAIQQGIAHGFKSGIAPYSQSPSINLIRFHDEMVGDRVRGMTLLGFDVKERLQIMAR